MNLYKISELTISTSAFKMATFKQVEDRMGDVFYEWGWSRVGDDGWNWEWGMKVGNR